MTQRRSVITVARLIHKTNLMNHVEKEHECEMEENSAFQVTQNTSVITVARLIHKTHLMNQV